jgi:aspartyl-tRNA(Asn)/glutamyl-tRNA(Gln) amidotransferase subunit C
MAAAKSVDYVAKLARIALSEAEKAAQAQQLSKIIDYIDKLKELDTSGIAPMRGAIVPRDVWRQDKPEPFAGTADILDNAPLSEAGYFKVPKIKE